MHTLTPLSHTPLTHTLHSHSHTPLSHTPHSHTPHTHSTLSHSTLSHALHSLILHTLTFCTLTLLSSHSTLTLHTLNSTRSHSIHSTLTLHTHTPLPHTPLSLHTLHSLIQFPLIPLLHTPHAPPSLKSVAPKWKNLGDLLDFDREGRTLELIEANQQKNHVACCREMFVYCFFSVYCFNGNDPANKHLG